MRLGRDYGERRRKPEEIGISCAEGVVAQMRGVHEPPPINHPANERYADQFYTLARINEVLGVKGEDT
jgi:hypothetical protein